MRTVDARLMVLAISTRAAAYTLTQTASMSGEEYTNALDSLAEIANQLEEAARAGESAEGNGAQGPSDGEMLEWALEHLIEKRAAYPGVAVRWLFGDFEDLWTTGKDTRDAIRNAMKSMREQQAAEGAT